MTIPTDLQHLVIELPKFVDPEFCTHMIARSNEIGFHAATITTTERTAVIEEIRNNDRVIFDDPKLAETLWQRLRPSFSEPFKGHSPAGLNTRFRIYRYRAGQYFDWHQDGEYRAPSGLRNMFTFMIYMKDGCEGGGTSFADVFSPYVFSDFPIAPETGKALVFHHPLSHRGDPILAGEKFVLRTDVMFADPS
ncbi:MAG: 2OG-Fe(II) oxygenase [Pelagimonas sp.]|jgi:hypothetical protein|nr:2OG-Fe(II) oxygenase [Pelagimonas sp.]